MSINNCSLYFNWSNSLLSNPLFGSNINSCPGLSESRIIISITEPIVKISMLLSFTIPIIQLLGLFGATWSIAVVLMSNHISFIKTKYFYTTVFAADLMANVTILGVDKFILWIINFKPDFLFHIINNYSVIMCKLTRCFYNFVLTVVMGVNPSGLGGCSLSCF